MNGKRLIKVNGHVITAMEGTNGRTYWTIHPANSEVKFCFDKFTYAYVFAKKYANRHGRKFWYRIWHGNPILQYETYLRVISEL